MNSKINYLPVNGINIYYEIHGTGEPLLLIHGLGSSTQDWEYQLPYFINHYQVITFDLRGHGKTDKPKGPYTIALFASDTAYLIRNFFSKGVHVVGHSLGGMIAFQLALDFPDLVKSLTIVNSAPAVTFPSFKDHFLFSLRSFSVRFFGMTKLSAAIAKILFPKPSQATLREICFQRLCQNDPQAYLNTLQAFPGWNVLHRLSNLSCPTLIITADHDYTPIAFKQFYTKLIPNAQLKVIKDSGHMTIVDQAEVFNKILAEFLLKEQ